MCNSVVTKAAQPLGLPLLCHREFKQAVSSFLRQQVRQHKDFWRRFIYRLSSCDRQKRIHQAYPLQSFATTEVMVMDDATQMYLSAVPQTTQ